MAKDALKLEICTENTWKLAATLNSENTTLGYRGASSLIYEEEYVELNLLKSDIHALSCRLPVSYEFHRLENWPSFILDILPSGAGRRFWLSKLSLKNEATSDWKLLSIGSGNSPGNIRIRKAEDEEEAFSNHSGFDKSKILERSEDFIEYALETGAPITGSSGAQGDAPKFLLTQDKLGKWHADGALADKDTSKHWIVKFPRGKHESDRKILRNEAEYMRLASLLGLNVNSLPHFENDALFIPRFDRDIILNKNSQTVTRLGLESFCSASGISEYGYIFKLEDLCKVIYAYSTSPEQDLLEFIFRDILNLICGNTDNHARNSSFLKYPNGDVRLSPLYDFAPMYLDREGIARLNKWKMFEQSGKLNINELINWLTKEFKLKKKDVNTSFENFLENFNGIEKILEQTSIDQDIKERILLRAENVIKNWSQ